MRLNFTIYVLSVLLAISSVELHAQTFSSDGNRWYEIEVSIFSNENAETNSELFIPDKIELHYPEQIRQLIPASNSFLIDFEKGNAASPAIVNSLPSVLIGVQTENQETALSESKVEIGPENYSGASDFRITDFNSDPYIALGNEHAEFLEYNLDIARSNEHRILYHAVWRQPVLNRVQATALYISGGEVFNGHHELEGSLRFSYNINRVDVEALLWRSRFTSPGNDPVNLLGEVASVSSWTIPAPPFDSSNETDFSIRINEALNQPLNSVYRVEGLSYMHQERAMISNELHYLDHPDIGMLVEIRPYQLPEPSEFFD